MKFGKYIITALIVIAGIVLGITFLGKKELGSIRPMDFEKDYKRIDDLFHKGDNWYWMLCDYSRAHGYDLEHTLRYKTSSQYAKKNDLIMRVMEIDDKIAGFMAYYPKSPYAWQFLFLLIDQDFRGQGVAKKLLAYALNDMSKLGAIKIELVTRLENARAQGLYTKFGFKITGKSDEHVYMSWHKN